MNFLKLRKYSRQKNISVIKRISGATLPMFNRKLTADSDIDLALIFTDLDDSRWFETQVQLMMPAAKIDSRIEPHPISNEDFNSGNPFVVEIIKTGIRITPELIQQN